MIVIVIFAAIAIALFAGAFLSKRRFGLLGLALTAGATLSTIWGDTAGLMLAGTGLVPDGPFTNAIALSVVVLLPAVLLLFHGYTYKGTLPRIVGSILFTVLALAFLVGPIGYALPLTGLANQAYSLLVEYKDIIISAGVILAVVDLFFTKPAPKKSREHHR